jgi:hypothetical protein
VGENSFLERVTAAAEERRLSQNTLIAYRRTWLKLIAWSTAEGLALATLPLNRAGEFYEEATCGRSASHHLQVKAALPVEELIKAVLRPDPSKDAFLRDVVSGNEKHTLDKIRELVC